MRKRAFNALASFLMIFALSGTAHSGITPLQLEVEEALICLCGCGQTIKNCPHENCGFAIPAKEQISGYVEEGKSKGEIMEIFTNKYGEEVLSSPSKKGFNLLGYIIPFAALILAGGLIMFIIKQWTSKGIKDEATILEDMKKDFGSDIDRKIEKELEEMD